MVDFQSRDTSRGFGSDDDEEEETDEEEAVDEGEAEATAPAADEAGPDEEGQPDQHEVADPDAGAADPDPEKTPVQEAGQASVETDSAPPAEPEAGTDAEAGAGTDAESGAGRETEPATGDRRVETQTGQPTADQPSETSVGSADIADAPPQATTTPGSESDSAAYAVVTISNERSLSDDQQGDVVVEAIESAGDRVLTRDLVQSGYDNVQSTISTLAERSDIDVVVTIGGTGVEPTDVTAEALKPLFEKQLPGFGELFRLLAHETEGAAVIGTRATAGLIDQTPVFALPGTLSGVQLGMSEIILPESPHLVADATPDR